MIDQTTTPPTPSKITAQQVANLWQRTESRFPQSRRRILFCRDLQRGAIGVTLPKTYLGTGKDAEALAQVLVVSHPLKKTLPIQKTAKLTKKFAACTLRRNPIGESDAAKKQATDFETWVNAVSDELLDRGGVIGRLVQQAEFGLFFLPSPADWEQSPDYLETVNGKEQVRGRYQRDSRGHGPTDSSYSGSDSGASRRAHKSETDDYLARRLPFRVRVESPLNCLPILARGSSKDPWRTIGMVVRTLYEREELIRQNFLWPSMSNTALIPVGHDSNNPSPYGAYGQVYLYEAWMIDENGDPYIVYSCGAESTTMKMSQDTGRVADAVIDLRKEYGLRRLPCRYIWGNHLEDDSPDERGVPLMDPIAGAILNVEGYLTHEMVYAKRTAFPGFGVEVNPDLPAAAFLDAAGGLKPIDIPSDGGVTLLPGKIMPLMTPRTGDGGRYVTQQLLGQIMQSTPDESVMGGGGGESGHQDVIQNEYFEAAEEMTLEGARQALEFVGECAAELACSAARGEWRVLDGEGVNIPVYANVEIIPGNDTAKGGPLRQLSEFKEQWIGHNNYDLTAYYPQEGNLAEVAQLAELRTQGLATFDDVMEARGKTSPEVERAKIDADRWLASPEGQMYLSQRFAAYRGDLEAAEKARLQLEGRLSQPDPQSGVQPLPTAALAQPGQAMTGTAQPNIAQSQLAGIVSGQMQSGPIQADAQAQSNIQNGQGSY